MAKTARKSSTSSKRSRISSSSRSSLQKEEELSFDLGKIGLWLKKRWYIIVALLVIAVLIVLNVYYQNFIKSAAVPEDAVATVNGQVITRQEMDDRYRILSSDLRSRMSEEQFLEQLIQVKLLVQEAKGLGINVTDSQVISSMNTMISSERASAGAERFDAYLREMNLTLEGYVSLNFEPLREQIIVTILLERDVFSGIEVDEAQLRAAYDRNIESFMAPPQTIRARHILVTTEEEANAIIKRLDAGEDFAQLAYDTSVGASKQYAGDLGFINKTSVVPEFSKAAFALDVEEYTKTPVQTQFGWHVIKREADVISFEEVREFLRLNELSLAKDKALNDYITLLKEKAVIVNYYSSSKLPDNKKISSFIMTEEPLCLEGGLPLVVMYTTSDSLHGQWVEAAFKSVANEYDGKVKAHIYVMDTGDDSMTEAVESAVPPAELQRFYHFHKEGGVPSFVFGCSYSRTGTYWELENDLDAEKAEFRAVMDELLTVV